MDLPQLSYLGSLVVFGILEVFAILVFLRYMALRDNYNELKQKSELIKASLAGRSQEIEIEAKREAIRVIAEANATASDLVAQAGKISKEAKDEFRSELMGLYKNQVGVLDELLIDAKKETAQVLSKVSSDLSGQIISESKTLVNKLTDDLSQAQKHYLELIDSKIKEVDLELDEYKKKRMEKADAVLKIMTKEIFLSVLKKKITDVQQEEIVRDSLEDLRREDVL
jgi:hypothetical protein